MAREDGPAKGDLTIFLMCFGPAFALILWGAGYCIVKMLGAIT